MASLSYPLIILVRVRKDNQIWMLAFCTKNSAQSNVVQISNKCLKNKDSLLPKLWFSNFPLRG